MVKLDLYDSSSASETGSLVEGTVGDVVTTARSVRFRLRPSVSEPNIARASSRISDASRPCDCRLNMTAHSPASSGYFDELEESKFSSPYSLLKLPSPSAGRTTTPQKTEGARKWHSGALLASPTRTAHLAPGTPSASCSSTSTLVIPPKRSHKSGGNGGKDKDKLFSVKRIKKSMSSKKSKARDKQFIATTLVSPPSMVPVLLRNGLPGGDMDGLADAEVDAVMMMGSARSTADSDSLSNGNNQGRNGSPSAMSIGGGDKRSSRLSVNTHKSDSRASKENLTNGSPHSRSSSPKPGHGQNSKERKYGSHTSSTGKIQHVASSMLNASLKLISPTYKQRSDEFRKLFKDVPEGEKFVIDYSCALQKEILVQGRLYLSLNYVCFYANIFRWETCFAVSLKDIEHITKEKTAKVFPNAIQVTTKSGDKFFFTSFTQREKAFMILFKVWQYSLLDQLLNPADLWAWVRQGGPDIYGDDRSSDNEDDDRSVADRNLLNVEAGGGDDDTSMNSSETPERPTFEVGSGVDSFSVKDASPSVDAKKTGKRKKKDRSHSRAKKPAPSIVDVEEQVNGFLADLGVSPQSSDEPMLDCSDTEDADIGCSCASHQGKEMLTEVYPVSVDQMFLTLFTDSNFYRTLQDYRKTTDIILSDWKADQQLGTKSREITYTIALNHAMGPKTCGVCEKQTVTRVSRAGQSYVVQCDVQNYGIPYSDSFSVVNTYCISRVSAISCRLRIHGGVQYRRSCWGIVKNFIEKNALVGLQDFFNDMDSHLQAECQRLGLAPPRSSVTNLTDKNSNLLPSDSRMADSGAGLVSTQAAGASGGPFGVDRRKDSVGSRGGIANPSFESFTMKLLVLSVLFSLLLNCMLVYQFWGSGGSGRSGETGTRWQFQEQTFSDLKAILEKKPLTTDEWLRLFRDERVIYFDRIDEWIRFVEQTRLTVEMLETTVQDLKSRLSVAQSQYEEFKSLSASISTVNQNGLDQMNCVRSTDSDSEPTK